MRSELAFHPLYPSPFIIDLTLINSIAQLNTNTNLVVGSPFKMSHTPLFLDN